MKHFQLYELIDKVTFEKYGEDAWKLFTPELLYSLDGLRDFLNVPIAINNWWDNTSSYFRQFSGYRPPDCTVGAPLSEHRKGNAADCHIDGADYDKLRLHIMDNKDNPLLMKIMRLEADVNWLHLDCGAIPQGQKRIYLFKA